MVLLFLNDNHCDSASVMTKLGRLQCWRLGPMTSVKSGVEMLLLFAQLVEFFLSNVGSSR